MTGPKRWLRSALMALCLLSVGLAGAPLPQAPAAAAPAAPQAVTNTYLPLIMKHAPPRYLGVFVPLVDMGGWSGQVNQFRATSGREHGVYLISSGFGCEWADTISDINPQLSHIRNIGAMPLITWMPMDCTNNGTGNVNNLSLQDIIDGDWDGYITAWATAAGALGYPIFVRFGHEMNIPTYSWAGQHAFGPQGKTNYAAVAGQGCTLTNCYPAGDPNKEDGPERYIDAYRRVHDIAAPLAPNIIWVWNPNARNWPLASDAAWNHYSNYYPGSAYVDWVALDGYNWGTNSGNGHGYWIMFNEMFGAELNDLRARYPTKPQMIAEFAAVEDPANPNRKADFIRDAYAQALKYPNLKVLIWVQDDKFVDALHFCPGGPPHLCPQAADFRVNSSPQALQAYKDAIAIWASQAPYP